MVMKPLLHSGFGLGGILQRTLTQNVESIFPVGTHEYWMERALLVSMEAVGWSAPNPAVGCVIVRDGKVLAEGFTQEFKREHAERHDRPRHKKSDDG